MGKMKAIRRFPAAVRAAMQEAGAAATCVAVQLDGEAWEAALFLHCTGPEHREERRCLRKAQGNVPVGVEADVIKHASAAVVVLGLEAHISPVQPLVFEVLLVPGGATGHFEVLKLLCSQPRLAWFFGDSSGEVLHAQFLPLDAAQHEGFAELLAEAVDHDRMVRLTARHDANAALAEVASHYALRGAAATDARA